MHTHFSFGHLTSVKMNQDRISWLKAFSFFIGYNINSWQHISITKPLYKKKKKEFGVKKTIKIIP
jgi:hypothetical protein